MTSTRAPSPGPNATRRSVLRGATVTTALTMLSRILGLVREQVRSYYLGTSMASDAFGIATLLPNLLRRLFAEGAMTAAFVPVFAELRRKSSPDELNLFLSRFFTILTAVVTAVSVLGIVSSSYLVPMLFPGFAEVPGKTALTVALAQITWPYLAFVSVAAIVQGVLNSHRIFGPSAFTPVLLNLVTIGIVVVSAHRFLDPAHAFAWGFVAGGFVQLAFQWPYLRRVGVRIRPRFEMGPGVRKVLRVLLPGTFAAGIYQINVLVSQYIATSLEEGAVSALQFSLRLQELVLGVFVVSLSTVVLPVMSDQIVAADRDGAKDTLRFAASLVAFICLPATVGLLLVADPLVRLLFEWGQFDRHSTQMTSYALVFHSVGIYAIAMNRITTQAFYAMKDLRTPTIVAAFVMVLHAALAVGLSGPLRHGGVALAGGLAAAVNSAVLWALLRRRFGSLDTRAVLRSLGGISVASLVMGAAVWGARWALDPMQPGSRWMLALRTCALVAVGAVAYIGASRAMRLPEFEELWTVLRRKLRRR